MKLVKCINSINSAGKLTTNKIYKIQRERVENSITFLYLENVITNSTNTGFYKHRFIELEGNERILNILYGGPDAKEI